MSYDRVDIFTQALNASFVNSYTGPTETSAIDKALTIVPSKGRVENYPWLYPPPLMHEWKGYRQYAKLGETNYRVPNKTWTDEIEVLYEDLEDDQIDGFKKQAAQMARTAQLWPKIQVQINMAAGRTVPCFDGSYFFATSHTVGTGNNILTGTTSVVDNVTHAAVVLITSNSMVKPLMWQQREAPSFRTDAGDNEASKTRKVRWWSDMRGAPAVGFWWDALLITWSSTPVLADMLTTIGNANARLRSFTYPKNLASDPSTWIHGLTRFTADTVLIVCSNGIEHLVRQALTLPLIAQTTNPYVGWADYTPSGYLNDVT